MGSVHEPNSTDIPILLSLICLPGVPLKLTSFCLFKVVQGVFLGNATKLIDK